MMLKKDWQQLLVFLVIALALAKTVGAHRFFDLRETHISHYGWQRYIDFAKSTCRLEDDVYAKIHDSDPEYGYWNWEEAEFIKALRLKLIPETQAGDYSAIVKQNRLNAIDHRLLAAELPSLCTNDNKSDEEILSESDKIIREHNAFEDVLINTLVQRLQNCVLHIPCDPLSADRDTAAVSCFHFVMSSDRTIVTDLKSDARLEQLLPGNINLYNVGG